MDWAQQERTRQKTNKLDKSGHDVQYRTEQYITLLKTVQDKSGQDMKGMVMIRQDKIKLDLTG